MQMSKAKELGYHWHLDLCQEKQKHPEQWHGFETNREGQGSAIEKTSQTDREKSSSLKYCQQRGKLRQEKSKVKICLAVWPLRKTCLEKQKAKKAMQEWWWWQSLDCHGKEASTLGEGARKTAGQALEWQMQGFRSKDSHKSFSRGVLLWREMEMGKCCDRKGRLTVCVICACAHTCTLSTFYRCYSLHVRAHTYAQYPPSTDVILCPREMQPKNHNHI